MPKREFKFGFLPEPWEFDNEDFAIEPLPDYDDLFEQIQTCDGHIEPPVMVLVEESFDTVSYGGAMRRVQDGVLRTQVELTRIHTLPTNARVVEGSEHCSVMMKPPPSHTLVLKNARKKDPRRGSAGFIVQILAFLAGTRLQFEDWWIDGRVPLARDKRSTPAIFVLDRPKFVELALKKYKSLNTIVDKKGMVKSGKSRKTSFINALYLFGRSKSCAIEWELFLIEYFALEALWYASGLTVCRTSHKKNSKYNGLHFRRFKTLAREYGLHFKSRGEVDTRGQRWPPTKKRALEIVELRNNLVHQGLWEEGTPGEAAKGTSARYAPYYLRNFLQGLIVAFILGRNNYSSWDWAKLSGAPMLRLPDED